MASVAILGGGISGLSTAYYLSKASQNTKIILIESSKRLGGWIQSQRVSPGFHASVPTLPSQDTPNVLFEVGPRSLRPVGAGGAAILSLCRDLQLDNDMLFVPKSDPSAKNRYIYYNKQINTLPSSLPSLLFNAPPIFKGVVKSILAEPFVEKGNGQDESLYAFVSRRFGDHVALNLVGAITHGVYAGDAKQLSVKSTMRMLYDAEQRHGSVVKGMFQKSAQLASEEQMIIDELGDHQEKTASVFGFKEGTETLTRHLKRYLQQQPNITLLTDKTVYSEDASIHVNHVISTIPSRKLDPLLKTSSLPNLCYNPAVNVAVVNFAFEDLKLPYNGFGFLTPHPDSPSVLPLPGTLGVVFDSNAMKGQEKDSRWTKLTVMMGGHMWNETFGGAKPSQVDPVHVSQLAREALSLCLGITDEPTFSMVNVLPECIPQYLVGHTARMGELHQAIQHQYPHLLSVTGASYLGVSVPDCVKHARLLVQGLLETGALGTKSKVITGLNKVI